MAEHTGEICTGLAGQSGAAQAQNSGNCTRLRLVAMASNAHRCPGMPLDEALWLWTWLWCCGECGCGCGCGCGWSWSCDCDCGCGCGCGCRCQGSLGRIKPFCASIMLFLLRLVGDRNATPPSPPSTPPSLATCLTLLLAVLKGFHRGSCLVRLRSILVSRGSISGVCFCEGITPQLKWLPSPLRSVHDCHK